jgi:two-component system chemotaxis sensor kinase CheA
LLELDQGGDFRSCFDQVFRTFHNLKGSAGIMDLTEVENHTHKLETILMNLKDEDSMPKVFITFFLNGIDATRSLLDGEKVSFSYEVDSSEDIGHLKISQIEPQTDTDLDSVQGECMSQEAIAEFVSDSEEILGRVSLYLEIIEKNSDDSSAIDCFYREIHTLKGNSYLFSFGVVGALTHQMESNFESIREGEGTLTSEHINCLFKCINILESIFGEIKNSGNDKRFQAVSDLMIKALAVLANPGTAQETEVRSEESKSEANEIQHELEKCVAVQEQELEHEQEANATITAVKKENANANASIRVPVPLLDSLMTLVGEMVLVRNQVLQFAGEVEDLDFLKMSKKLNIVTSEIQEEMMKTRMQPISNLLQKFSRVVRDLSSELQKEITISFEGSETELDKNLLEAIKDPLTHIVRNSCDHGIELPDIRVANGKAAGGEINIKSYHEGGQVIIEITDDGKGLDKEALLEKAIEKGVINSSEAERLSDKDIFSLIFAPGFSTAAAITNVSGRGVGMDVVRTNIEKIGGSIDLQSKVGLGTTIKIKIPLTLAIMPALIVKCEDMDYAIPQVSIKELVRVDSEDESNQIEMLHGGPVWRLRGSIIPLVDLANLLRPTIQQRKDYSQTNCNIVFVDSGQGTFGVIVDDVQDTIDIVVKPINKLLKNLQIYSGATILGDGSVTLILDMLGVSRVAQVDNYKIDAEVEEDLVTGEEKDFLLFMLNSNTKHAIALSYVDRLEEFKSSIIENSAGESVIRYGDALLPLIYMSEVFTGEKFSQEGVDTLSVVVVEKAGRFYGLVVEQILDTLSTSHNLDLPLVAEGFVFGNLIMEEELIVVLNPFEFIDKRFPQNKVGAGEVSKDVSEMTPKVILLVEDTVFFRKTISQCLESVGHTVVCAGDGQEGLNQLEKRSDIELIVSDIEMPNLNGFEMAKAIRGRSEFQEIPMIAVSSKADDKHIKKGKEAGFNMYLEKLKQDQLLESISSFRTGKKAS